MNVEKLISFYTAVANVLIVDANNANLFYRIAKIFQNVILESGIKCVIFFYVC